MNSAKVESQINTDLDRTFPDNIYFSDNSTNDHKIMLFQVLKAYGNYRPEIGYCQVSFSCIVLVFNYK